MCLQKKRLILNKFMSDKKPILMFDWDGTVVDSNQYKLSGAWLATFEGEPEKQKAILEVLGNPETRKLYRYGLVARVISLTEDGNDDLKDVINTDEWIIADPRITKYTDKFAKLTQDHSMMPAFEDSYNTLKALSERGYTMYVVSGASVDTIKEQIRLYDLDFFKDVFGNFDSKPNHFKTISNIEGISDPLQYISIGDGKVDRDFAKEVGCRFIGIPCKWNDWKKGEMDFETIDSIGELLDLLE